MLAQDLDSVGNIITNAELLEAAAEPSSAEEGKWSGVKCSALNKRQTEYALLDVRAPCLHIIFLPVVINGFNIIVVITLNIVGGQPFNSTMADSYSPFPPGIIALCSQQIVALEDLKCQNDLESQATIYNYSTVINRNSLYIHSLHGDIPKIHFALALFGRSGSSNHKHD